MTSFNEHGGTQEGMQYDSASKVLRRQNWARYFELPQEIRGATMDHFLADDVDSAISINRCTPPSTINGPVAEPIVLELPPHRTLINLAGAACLHPATFER